MLLHQLPERGEITAACPLDQFALGVQWTALHRLARPYYTAAHESVPRNPTAPAGVMRSMTTKLRILVVALLVAGIALVPTPAYAKGAGSAKITGPGLDQPIQFDHVELSATQLAKITGLSAVLWNEPPATIGPRATPGRLGAKYVITYDWMIGQDEDGYVYEPVRQELYPFARRGPVVFTPRGQRLFDQPVTSGWYQAGPKLRDTLIAVGVPRPRDANPR